MAKKSVKITETVLRDGQQSLAATRMRIVDMLPILEKMDSIGYHAIEAWGGATFDVCLRFLKKTPGSGSVFSKRISKPRSRCCFAGKTFSAIIPWQMT